MKKVAILIPASPNSAFFFPKSPHFAAGGGDRAVGCC
jgi:hypothetical protein